MTPAWVAAAVMVYLVGSATPLLAQPPLGAAAAAEMETIARGPIDRNDPLEVVNRHVHRFNARFDRFVFLPGLRAYRVLVPSPLRTGLSNFLNNLRQITSMANAIFQLAPKKSAKTLGRLLVNTTLGCAGLADPATHLGLGDYAEDFGQTLGRWGLGPGPYLVLPLAGPSSLRDGLGMLVDSTARSVVQDLAVDVAVVDPFYTPWLLVQGLQMRDDQPFRYGELGPFEYELVRYFYLEQRRAEIAY